MDKIQPTPRSALIGGAADALLGAQRFGNHARIPEGAPLIGGQGLGDLLLGAVPEEVDNWSYGDLPMTIDPGVTGSRVPRMKTGRSGGVADALMALLPSGKVAKAGQHSTMNASDALVRAITGNPQATAMRVIDEAPPILGAVRKGRAPDRMLEAQRNAALPRAQGGLGLSPDNTAADRMAAMGYERGWYRGGPEPRPDASGNTPNTGPWYTRDAEQAADYARRFGPDGDVREYAIPKGFYMQNDRAYGGPFLTDLAGVLRGSAHPGDAKLATELQAMAAAGEHAPAPMVMRSLQYNATDPVASYLSQMPAQGGVRGIKGVNSPDFVQMFQPGKVRDPARAAFDPNRVDVNDIYGRADPRLLGLIGGIGTAGAAFLDRD